MQLLLIKACHLLFITKILGFDLISNQAPYARFSEQNKVYAIC